MSDTERAGLALQAAWDDGSEVASGLPPIEFTPEEREHLARAVLATRPASQADALAEALEPFADIADLIDAETTGFEDSDECDLMYADYLMERFTVHQFRIARAALAAHRSHP